MIVIFVLALMQLIIGWVLQPECIARQSNVGAVIGDIDGITFDGTRFYVSGWAGQRGRSESLVLHIYADRSAYDNPRGTRVLDGIANLPNEPAVARLIQDNGLGKHRFKIPLPPDVLSNLQGRDLYVHGIRVVEGVPNSALNGSGSIKFPYLTLEGTYKSTPQHPRVFMSKTDLQNVVARINQRGTYSAQRFEYLMQLVKADLASQARWDATYSGNDIDVYLHAFSYEPHGGYASEQRTEDQLCDALNLPSGAIAPRGAAIVASRLALYAVMVKNGAIIPKNNAPAADDAVDLAKRILLAWANRGFRDPNGSLRKSIASYQDDQGRHIAAALQISRGIVYSVQAQDLLESIGALDANEHQELISFHQQMYDAIRQLSNEEAKHSFASKHPDETYNNQFACHLTALLAISRLLNDEQRLYATLYGADPHMPVHLPWTVLFNHVIYGVNDKPQLHVTPNATNDSATSSPSFSTPIVAAGEINDRYRHLGKLQAFGYTSGTLTAYYRMAEMLRMAGYDAYAYRGVHQQSIQMATDYYACFAKNVGFYKEVTAENACKCPDYQEYTGQVVNGLDVNVILGAYRFPQDRALVVLDGAAKAARPSSRPEAMDFGKWND